MARLNLTTVEQRFWSKVDKSGECWLWTASKGPNGYGSFFRDGWCGAHRYSYELAHGSIPEGLNVLHRCDVRSCVNPDHLFVGTQGENVADMFRKGRGLRARGEAQHLARLTPEKVLAIRASTGTYEQIAQRFGVSKPTIGKVIRRETWRHV